MISAVHDQHPEVECRRWSKQEKKYVQVKQPNVIKEYNSKMGGVDLADRMISYYRMGSRTKKWTIRIFLHFVDVALANSWMLDRQDNVASDMYPEKI